MTRQKLVTVYVAFQLSGNYVFWTTIMDFCHLIFMQAQLAFLLVPGCDSSKLKCKMGSGQNLEQTLHTWHEN